MSMMKLLGIPVPDKDGVFQIKIEEVGGEIRMSAGGIVFGKCLLKNGAPAVQIIDVDTGVIFEKNIQVLCWSR